MLTFHKEMLTQRLMPLSGRERLAFVLLICERLMPAMKEFAKATGFDFLFYRKCLNAVWDAIDRTGEQSLSSDLCQLEQECLERAPDTENFVHELTSAALNGALSVSHAVGFLCTRKVEHITEVAQLACDTTESIR